MDRIARIELYHVAIPLPARFYPSWIPGFPQTENRFTLIRVITEQGIEGWSAGPAMGRERAGLGELLGPYRIGKDATSIRRIQQRLRELSYLDRRNVRIEPASGTFRERGQVSRSCTTEVEFLLLPRRFVVQTSSTSGPSGSSRLAVFSASGLRGTKYARHRTTCGPTKANANIGCGSQPLCELLGGQPYPSSCTAPQALIDEAEAHFQEGF